LLGITRHATGAPPLVTGGIGGALVYSAAFSSKGAGTLTLTEPPPGLRGWRKQVSLIVVSSAFALATASLDAWLARRS
jgi:hypothetical protein